MNRFAYTSAEQFCDVQDTAGREFCGQCSQKLLDDCYVNSSSALEFPWSTMPTVRWICAAERMPTAVQAQCNA